jgi:hypothetical protein
VRKWRAASKHGATRTSSMLLGEGGLRNASGNSLSIDRDNSRYFDRDLNACMPPAQQCVGAIHAMV